MPIAVGRRRAAGTGARTNIRPNPRRVMVLTAAWLVRRGAADEKGMGLRHRPKRPETARTRMRVLRRVARYAVLAGGALAALTGVAVAQGKLEARYEVTLAGLQIGTGSWMVDIGDTHYLAAASGS